MEQQGFEGRDFSLVGFGGGGGVVGNFVGGEIDGKKVVVGGSGGRLCGLGVVSGDFIDDGVVWKKIWLEE